MGLLHKRSQGNLLTVKIHCTLHTINQYKLKMDKSTTLFILKKHIKELENVLENIYLFSCQKCTYKHKNEGRNYKERKS